MAVAPDQSIYKKKIKSFFKPADYVVCKFDVLGLNKYLASYYKNTKIRFNVLSPLVLRINRINYLRKYSNKTTLNRMSKSNEFNGAIQFLFSDASSYMTGSNLVIDRMDSNLIKKVKNSNNFKNPILIAEVGCNHKGDIEIAKKFIEVARDFCGLEYVKFQKRDPHTFNRG